jgi:hypothetical protein
MNTFDVLTRQNMFATYQTATAEENSIESCRECYKPWPLALAGAISSINRSSDRVSFTALFLFEDQRTNNTKKCYQG